MFYSVKEMIKNGKIELIVGDVCSIATITSSKNKEIALVGIQVKDDLKPFTYYARAENFNERFGELTIGDKVVMIVSKQNVKSKVVYSPEFIEFKMAKANELSYKDYISLLRSQEFKDLEEKSIIKVDKYLTQYVLGLIKLNGGTSEYLMSGDYGLQEVEKIKQLVKIINE